MRKDYIVLIVGKSGSGKSTICEHLENVYGLKEVKSYTTRPRRGDHDNTHTFVTQEEFDNLEGVCAWTEFNGYNYAATNEQVNESDLYVIDVDGVEYFFKHYKGKKIPMVVYIDASDIIRCARMLDRGDPWEGALSRLSHDANAFKNVEDYAVITYLNDTNTYKNVSDIAEKIHDEFFKEEE